MRICLQNIGKNNDEQVVRQYAHSIHAAQFHHIIPQANSTSAQKDKNEWKIKEQVGHRAAIFKLDCTYRSLRDHVKIQILC